MTNPKKKVSNRTLFILCGILLLLAAGSLLFSLDVSWTSLFPTAEDLDRIRRDEKKLKAQLYELELKNAGLQRTEQRYKELMANCWDESRLGSPDVLLPKNLSDLAKELNIENFSTSPLRRTKLNADLVQLELDVTTSSSLGDLIHFWTRLAAMNPPLVWKRIELRPDNPQIPDQLFFRGTASLYGREGGAEKAAPAAPAKGAAK